MKHRAVTIIPLTLPKVEPGTELGRLLAQAFKTHRLAPETGDVVSVASKIVSIAEGRIIRLSQIQSSARARLIAKKWRINPKLAQVIVDESDQILGGVRGFVLTIKRGILTPNAGVDQKNSPPGTVTVWPRNPDSVAEQLRRSLWKQFNARVGVEIVDSRITPLRMGTVGLAIGISGFSPIIDERGEEDIYDRTIRSTRVDIADDIASASHMVMGESDRRVGLVLIRGSAIRLGKFPSRLVQLRKERCLISSNLRSVS